MKKLAFFAPILIIIAVIIGCAKANDPVAPSDHDILVKDMESGTVMGDFRDMDVTDQYIFVAEDNMGFSIWNRSNLTKVSQNWHFEVDYRAVKLICAVEQYNRLFINNIEGSDGIYVFDYTDPTALAFVGMGIGGTQGIEDMEFRVNTHEFPAIEDDSTSQIIGLRSLDNVVRYSLYQTSPTEHWVSSPDELIATLPLDVKGFDEDHDYIYIAGDQAGVFIVSKADFSVVGQCDTPGEALTVKINGDILYVADRQDGLTVINVADRANPVKLDTGYDLSYGYGYSLDFEGNWLALAAGGGGAYLFDITDPAAPKFADRAPTSQVGYTRRVDLYNGYLYVGSRDNGIVRLSIHP